MTYAPIYGPRRRRPNRRPFIGVTVAALGMLALVAVADWPDAPPPPPPPRPPAVGDLLHAGRHSAIVLGVLPLHGGSVLAAVRFVRGPLAGAVTYRVQGCPAGGELVNLATGALRAWERGEPGIFAAVAAVACGEPPPTVGVAT